MANTQQSEFEIFGSLGVVHKEVNEILSEENRPDSVNEILDHGSQSNTGNSEEMSAPDSGASPRATSVDPDMEVLRQHGCDGFYNSEQISGPRSTADQEYFDYISGLSAFNEDIFYNFDGLFPDDVDMNMKGLPDESTVKNELKTSKTDTQASRADMTAPTDGYNTAVNAGQQCSNGSTAVTQKEHALIPEPTNPSVEMDLYEKDMLVTDAHNAAIVEVGQQGSDSSFVATQQEHVLVTNLTSSSTEENLNEQVTSVMEKPMRPVGQEDGFRGTTATQVGANVPTTQDAMTLLDDYDHPMDGIDYDRVLLQMYQTGPVTSPIAGEDAQVERVMSVMPPPLPMLGSEPERFCMRCFRAGHDSENKTNCPAGRIENHNSSPGNIMDAYVHLDRQSAQFMFFSDVKAVVESLSWGISVMAREIGQEVGVNWPAVALLRALLRDCQANENDPAWTMGGILSTAGGLMPTGEPGAPMRDGEQIGPIRAQFQYPEVKITAAPPPESPVPVKTPRKKADVIGDLADLPILGNRPTTECNNCLYRGHAKNSVKLCPIGILKTAIGRMEYGKRRYSGNIEDCKKAIRQVQAVMGLLPAADERLEDLQAVLDEYERAGEKLKPGNAKKAAAVPQESARYSGQTSTVAGSYVIPHPPPTFHEDVFANSDVSVTSQDIHTKSDFPGNAWELSARLRIIGNRPDVLCGNCNHRGHDRRSHSCPHFLVTRSVESADIDKIRAAEPSAVDLENVVRLRNELPADGQDFTDSLQSVLATFWQMKFQGSGQPQLGHKRQKKSMSFSAIPMPSPSPIYDFNSFQPMELDSPQATLSPGPSTSYSSAMGKSPSLQPDALGGPMGIFVDHTKISAALLMKLLPYAIHNDEDYGALQLDHTRMGPSLITEIAGYLVTPEAGVKRKAGF